jgi:two-component system, cell cycle response regulator
MLHRRKATVAGISFLLILLLCHFIGGPVSTFGVPVLCLLAIGYLALQLRLVRKRPRQVSQRHATGVYPSLARSLEKEIGAKTTALGAEVLGTQYRRSRREETEQVIDTILDDYLRLTRARLDAHTVAVFFPADDGGYKIRRYWSASTCINKEAVIYPGVGIIGSFLKDGLKHLNLQEIITDSVTLYYYTRDAGIRSLMASPIMAEGVERGYVIVDSTEKKHFSDEDHAYLTTVASVLGQSVYYTYLYSEHKLKHERLAAMSSTENDFFKHLTLDAILDKIVEIVPFAISCDRLTISIKAGDGKSAVIRRAGGGNSQGVQDKTFLLQDRVLVSLVFSNDICLMRDFAADHYEVRFCAGEPEHTDFASFLALPFGLDESKGVLLLESVRHDAFTEAHRDLLSRLATSAGLAIQKLHLYDRANALATHDGLTGLVNHRQFQSQLRDEIIRATRYQEPLALVICDIDYFKKVNDTHGHPFGDTVLKGVAAKLQESIRETIDVAARYGGEEFALILVKSDTPRAIETAERIRQSVSQIRFQTGRGQEVSVTMSFGIAVYGVHAKDGDSLIKKADKALYRAKQDGRNRVEVFYMAEEEKRKPVA